MSWILTGQESKPEIIVCVFTCRVLEEDLYLINKEITNLKRSLPAQRKSSLRQPNKYAAWDNPVERQFRRMLALLRNPLFHEEINFTCLGKQLLFQFGALHLLLWLQPSRQLDEVTYYWLGKNAIGFVFYKKNNPRQPLADNSDHSFPTKKRGFRLVCARMIHSKKKIFFWEFLLLHVSKKSKFWSTPARHDGVVGALVVERRVVW